MFRNPKKADVFYGQPLTLQQNLKIISILIYNGRYIEHPSIFVNALDLFIYVGNKILVDVHCETILGRLNIYFFFVIFFKH